MNEWMNWDCVLLNQQTTKYLFQFIFSNRHVKLLSVTSRPLLNACLTSWSTLLRDLLTAMPSRRRMSSSVLLNLTDKSCAFILKSKRICCSGQIYLIRLKFYGFFVSSCGFEILKKKKTGFRKFLRFWFIWKWE